MGALSRRALFGTGAGLSLAGSAAAAPLLTADTANPDAELIRLCADCDAVQAKIDAIWAQKMTHLPNPEQIAIEDVRTAAQQPFLEQMDPLLERVCKLQATTLQGHAARARTLLGWDKDPCWVDDYCWNSQLIGAIVRDLVGAA